MSAVIRTGGGEAVIMVGAAAHLVSVGVVLTVIFPPANAANAVKAAARQCGETAAWAGDP